MDFLIDLINISINITTHIYLSDLLVRTFKFNSLTCMLTDFNHVQLSVTPWTI